jgi:hypothetical protein
MNCAAAALAAANDVRQSPQGQETQGNQQAAMIAASPIMRRAR